jgi:glycosyltransferase involved in cell wall biosynthesis
VSEQCSQTVPVAVIIPCYNYGHFISSTIESVLKQTVRPVEIIVVDDGSTDETKIQCLKYDQVKYIYQENRGLSGARNTGLEESSAQYVMFLDADDILCTNGLEILWGALCELSHEYPVVFGRGESFDQFDVTKREPSFLPSSSAVFPYVDKEISDELFLLSRTILKRIIKGSIVPACSALIHRSVYEQVGTWNETIRYIEDREMWLRIASQFQLAYVNQTISKVRKHSDNITHEKNWIRNHESVLGVLNRVRVEGWPDGYLRELAAHQYGADAYILAQRYADRGEFSRASRLMSSSWFADRRRWKSFVQMINYYMQSLGKR